MAQPIDPFKLYEEFREVPFRPRRVHLSDGESIDIASRRHVIVGADYLDIGIQASDEAFGICEKVVTVPLAMIDRLEVLKTDSD